MVVDNVEVDGEEVTHHLRREMEELRVENRKLKKEVEELMRRGCVWGMNETRGLASTAD